MTIFFKNWLPTLLRLKVKIFARTYMIRPYCPSDWMSYHTLHLSTPMTLAFLLFLEHNKPLHILFPLYRTPFPQVFSCLALSLHSVIFLNITISEKFSLTILCQIDLPNPKCLIFFLPPNPHPINIFVVYCPPSTHPH